MIEELMSLAWNVVMTRVLDKYRQSCTKWKAKPNSQVIAELERVAAQKGLNDQPPDETHYCFDNAHIGDRGCACILIALAADPRVSSVSFHGCCLRGGSSASLAAFIELHPHLKEIDLSNNHLSYEFGEQLLQALEKRSEYRKEGAELMREVLARGRSSPPPNPLSHRKNSFSGQPGMRGTSTNAGRPDSSRRDRNPTQFPNLRSSNKTPSPDLQRRPVIFNVCTVNLEGTWFQWDSSNSGRTVGPPPGNFWAGQDSRSKLAPTSYEKLRSQLESTKLITYKAKVEPPRWESKGSLFSLDAHLDMESLDGHAGSRSPSTRLPTAIKDVR